MKKNYCIAFSGCSNAGKTTSINNVKDYFGDDAVILDEVIRRKKDFNIDEIRADANAYVDFQIEVISKKIEEEKNAIKKHEAKIILIDRSLVDSMMYFLFYIDKSKLDSKHLQKYFDFYNVIHEACSVHLNSVYDKVIFLPALKNIKQENFRTKNLKYFQQIEGDLIYNLTNSFLNDKTKFVLYEPKKKFDFFDFFISLKDHVLIQVLNDYSTYRKTIEEEDYPLDNIIMNSRNSAIKITQDLHMSRQSLYLNSCLFCDRDEEVGYTKQLFEKIKQLEVAEEFRNSLCYPTGFISPKCSMIIGEAPGVKGRGLSNRFMKPAFTFTQTSHYLKTAAFTSGEEFYITNAVKYSIEENNTKEEDFRNCFDILMDEIEYINPAKIFVLGCKTYDFLKEELPNKIFKKCRLVDHPAYAVRSGISKLEYSQNFFSRHVTKKEATI